MANPDVPELTTDDVKSEETVPTNDVDRKKVEGIPQAPSSEKTVEVENKSPSIKDPQYPSESDKVTPMPTTTVETNDVRDADDTLPISENKIDLENPPSTAEVQLDKQNRQNHSRRSEHSYDSNESDSSTKDQQVDPNIRDSKTHDWEYNSKESESPTKDRRLVQNTMDSPTQDREYNSEESDSSTKDRRLDRNTSDSPTKDQQFDSNTMDSPTQDQQFDSKELDSSTKDQRFDQNTVDSPTKERQLDPSTVDSPTKDLQFDSNSAKSITLSATTQDSNSLRKDRRLDPMDHPTKERRLDPSLVDRPTKDQRLDPGTVDSTAKDQRFGSNMSDSPTQDRQFDSKDQQFDSRKSRSSSEDQEFDSRALGSNTKEGQYMMLDSPSKDQHFHSEASDSQMKNAHPVRHKERPEDKERSSVSGIGKAENDPDFEDFEHSNQPPFPPPPPLTPAKVVGTVADMRTALIARIVPDSIVPVAVSNAMLFVGVQETHHACEFPLTEYLIVAGTISLLIGVVAILFRYIIDWILQTGSISRADHMILLFIGGLGQLISVLEIGLFVAGTIYVFPHLIHVQFDDEEGDHFCDQSMYMFAAVLFGTITLIVALNALGIIYIYIDTKIRNFARKRAMRM